MIGPPAASSTAGLCALGSPTAFDAVAMMRSPFAERRPCLRHGGWPRVGRAPRRPSRAIWRALPASRKHYQRYYSTRSAMRCGGVPQNVMPSSSAAPTTGAPPGRTAVPMSAEAHHRYAQMTR